MNGRERNWKGRKGKETKRKEKSEMTSTLKVFLLLFYFLRCSFYPFTGSPSQSTIRATATNYKPHNKPVAHPNPLSEPLLQTINFTTNR